MPSKRKLLMRVRNNPRDVRFSDLVRLVEAAGFVPIPQRGTSHRQYVHPITGAYLNLRPRRNGKAKEFQVRQFLDAVEEYGLRMEDVET